MTRFNLVGHKSLLARTVARGAYAEGPVIKFLETVVKLFNCDCPGGWFVGAMWAARVVTRITFEKGAGIGIVVVSGITIVEVEWGRAIANIAEENR